ncbi:hypothetical protein B6U67_00370 [Methanosarcinales archaeon ex4484_138]|nr:MAG: hypothetical protein B6U67_00370 [Methanosarcinales archaeon ex4484_138]RLG26578.1 MAG: hypothetical protein DRN85_02560 [Methanosarcinales archaeon]
MHNKNFTMLYIICLFHVLSVNITHILNLGWCKQISGILVIRGNQSHSTIQVLIPIIQQIHNTPIQTPQVQICANREQYQLNSNRLLEFQIIQVCRLMF